MLGIFAGRFDGLKLALSTLAAIGLMVLTACVVPPYNQTLPVPDNQQAQNSTQTPTQPPVPPTATVTPTPVPPTATPIPCDRLVFVRDVKVTDGQTFTAGEAFTKTWRLKNAGSCKWTTNYAMVFVDGDALNAQTVINLPKEVAVNEEIELSVDLKAPDVPGNYRGNWKLRNADGAAFGSDGDKPFYVSIKVNPAGYNFATNICSAKWFSGAGEFDCSVPSDDLRGSAEWIKDRYLTLENGEKIHENAILMRPQLVDNGVISLRYPLMPVYAGQHFTAQIGCLAEATFCDVIFQLNYRNEDGVLYSLGSWREQNDRTPTAAGYVTNIDVDLSALNGKKVQISLAMMANGRPFQAWGVWVNPQLVYR